MKYKYLKITGEFIWGKNTLEKQDLVDVATSRIDALVDVEAGKQFDAKANEWVDIKGD